MPFLFAKHPLITVSCGNKGPVTVNIRPYLLDAGARLVDSVARRRVHSTLAYLLLLTISYGAIVEAAHSHEVFSANPSQFAAFAGDDGSPSSYQGHSGHSECSLCQFQQQLFGSLASVILVAHSAQRFAFHSQQTVSYLSTSALPTRGRAPPTL